jgi:Rps23 Pro-64 3,4-dihydroxylase Tpa1-like proline 4-hydroxylase
METPNPTPSGPLGTDRLDVGERAKLKQLESVIAQGLHIFYQVGQALDEIREERLYREIHKTFEAYCQEKWGITRSRACRVIDAAQVMENLLPIGQQIPTNERQVRPLTGLPKAAQVEIWQKAVALAPNGIPTGAVVQRLVDEHNSTGVKPPPGEPASEVERLRQENQRLKERIRQQNLERQRRAAEVAAELERLRGENQELRAELRRWEKDWQYRLTLERAQIREELRSEYEDKINGLTAQVNSLLSRLEAIEGAKK